MFAAARRSRLRVCLVFTGLLLGWAGFSPGLASRAHAADEKCEYRVVEPSAVYFGNPRQFKKPATVDADRVYRAIPEYQEILEKNLTDRDVRYHFLLRKASEKFAAAVRSAAQDGGYDLVAGLRAVVGSTSSAPAIPEITDAILRKLSA